MSARSFWVKARWSWQEDASSKLPQTVVTDGITTQKVVFIVTAGKVSPRPPVRYT